MSAVCGRCGRTKSDAVCVCESPGLVLTYQTTMQTITLAPALQTILGRESGGREVLGLIRQVSAQHCVVSLREGAYRVRDFPSRHGTFVLNDADRTACTPSSESPLPDGAFLQLGRELFLVQYSHAVAAPPPPPSVVVGPEPKIRRCPACGLRAERTECDACGTYVP